MNGSKLQQILSQGKFAVTAEVGPPRGTNVEVVQNKAKNLAACVDAINVTGGWHAATDYLQYTATSANAVYHLLLAWKDHPEVYGDEHLANGLPGKNGIPDIIDEAIWGMEWLLKMNPAYGETYNQIADDRDHIRIDLQAPGRG